MIQQILHNMDTIIAFPGWYGKFSNQVSIALQHETWLKWPYMGNKNNFAKFLPSRDWNFKQ